MKPIEINQTEELNLKYLEPRLISPRSPDQLINLIAAALIIDNLSI